MLLKKQADIWLILTGLLVILVSIASLSGIFNPKTYSQETANWAQQAVGQDIGNVLAVPVLIVSAFFVHKKSFRALLIYLGTLLYLIYAYLIYAFFIHFNALFLVYVAILGLSFYIFIGSLVQQNVVHFVIAKKNRESRSAAIVLFLTGILFGGLWLSEIIPALLSAQVPKSIRDTGLWVNPIQVIDLAIVLPGMIMTAVLLVKNNWLARLFAAPWLTFSVLMGSSIIVTLIMELNKGNTQVIVPLFMVGIIVLASLVVLFKYLKRYE